MYFPIKCAFIYKKLLPTVFISNIAFENGRLNIVRLFAVYKQILFINSYRLSSYSMILQNILCIFLLIYEL